MDKIVYDKVLKSFKGKKVFITGHTGFKGTWLTYILTLVGADVMGYALEPYDGPSHFKMLNLEKKIKHVIGDIRNDQKLITTINDFEPEFVFHLAAQPLVKKSYNNPVETFGTNFMGSVNLLEAVKKCESVRSLVFVTSDKCYENVEWIWGYRENDRVGGHDPYSASKGAAEIAFSAYARSFFNDRPNLGAATARAGNVIGGGDWAEDRIVPDCIRAIESNLPIFIRNPKATRPWQHVLEPLSGYLLLAHKLRINPRKFEGAWNFGPPSSQVRTVDEVVNSLIKNFGRGEIKLSELSQKKLHEANLLQLNCDKAHQILNWEPTWNVNETIIETAEWYKFIMDGGSAIEITKKQLNKYFNTHL